MAFSAFFQTIATFVWNWSKKYEAVHLLSVLFLCLLLPVTHFHSLIPIWKQAWVLWSIKDCYDYIFIKLNIRFCCLPLPVNKSQPFSIGGICNKVITSLVSWYNQIIFLHVSIRDFHLMKTQVCLFTVFLYATRSLYKLRLTLGEYDDMPSDTVIFSLKS